MLWKVLKNTEGDIECECVGKKCVNGEGQTGKPKNVRQWKHCWNRTSYIRTIYQLEEVCLWGETLALQYMCERSSVGKLLAMQPYY